jgi:hypothetical protein
MSPTTTTPLLVSISDATAILDKSRSEIYNDIARGLLDAVKDGIRTKITYESLKRRAEALPKAELKLYVRKPKNVT